MTNNAKVSERDRIRSARYVPGGRYHRKLKETIAHLPDKEKKNVRNKALRALAVAAALLLAFALSAPTIVRAVGPVVERIFGLFGERETAFVDLPEDEKLLYVLKEVERYNRGHSVNASAAFGGATVTLLEVSFSPDNAYDDEITSGYMRGKIVFSEDLAFDPELMDFFLQYNGREYAMPHASPEEIAIGNGNTYRLDGVTEVFVGFDVDHWKIDEPTEITLKGVLDGDTFEIPFTFDPEKAHQEALAEAEGDVSLYEQISEERIEKLNALDSVSGAVGIMKEVDDYSFVITDIALSEEGNVNIGWAIYGLTEKNPKIALMSCHISEIVVDGYVSPWGGESDGEIVDGTLLIQGFRPLGRNPLILPEESLIQLDISIMDETASVAFRYDWQNMRATLPKDADEEAKWLDESHALYLKVKASTPVEMVYDLSQAMLSKTENGMTMTLTSLSLKENSAEVNFAITLEEPIEGIRLVDGSEREPELIIGGHRADYHSGLYVEGIVQSADFIMSSHMSEIAEPAQISFAYTVIAKKDGVEIDRATFDFDFTLHPTES